MDKKTGTAHEARGTRKDVIHLLLFLVASVALWGLQPCAFGAEKWPGVDESVVEKVAGEHGRSSRAPLINTDQGDMLLFVFLLAGAVGGFAAGYYWRMLTEGKAKPGEKKR
jgi:hypothetical protein